MKRRLCACFASPRVKAMLKLSQAIIVEGKYDKIKLSQFIDAVIVQTDGFAIFKDREKLDLIRLMAKKHGVIIITDSDSAGFIIRNFLQSAVTDGEIINVYIPEVLGRERRKATDSADGLLGVEGMSEQVILSALEKAGVTADRCDSPDLAQTVTKLDMYQDGFYGAAGAALLRQQLCLELGLPTRLSSNMLPEVITRLCGKTAYTQAVRTVKSLNDIG